MGIDNGFKKDEHPPTASEGPQGAQKVKLPLFGKSEPEGEPSNEGFDDLVEMLNRDFAITWAGGKGVIFKEFINPATGQKESLFTKTSAMKLLFDHYPRPTVDGKKLHFVDYWTRHPDARRYEGIINEPLPQAGDGFLNIFRGFSVEPEKGGCNLFLAHIRENVARGDQAVFDYILAWMADAIQNPTKKPGVALVLCGKPGTGKGVFATWFGKLWADPHFVHLTDFRKLFQKFNKHLQGAMLLFADEMTWKGKKMAAGPLKAIITEETFTVEGKFIDAYPIRNYARLIMASNDAHVVPASIDERRFCVLEMGSGRMQDAAYFKAISDHMENGGLAALLHFLQEYDLSGIDLRAFPRTKALKDQVYLSMAPVERFVFDFLGMGINRQASGKWDSTVPSENLQDDFKAFCKKSGKSAKGSATELGIGIKRLLPGVEKKRTMAQGKRQMVYEFPDLDECRNSFAPNWDWAGPF